MLVRDVRHVGELASKAKRRRAGMPAYHAFIAENPPMLMKCVYPGIVQLHKLRAFEAVAQHGNVHRAARAIHLSQPAVSRAVRQLEETLGAVLFERNTKGMTLTDEGRLVLRRVQRALGELRSAEREIRSLAGEARDGVRPRRVSDVITERMLWALVAIARYGGESAAAAMLQVTQPALNRTLRQLEELAAVDLFVRSGRGTRLTETGEVLLRHAKLALAEIRVATEELASMRGRLNGRLVVGALPLSSGYLVPAAVGRTLKAHPDLSISIIDGTYATLSYGLRCAEVNVIVGALRADDQEPYALHEPLFADSLNVVARAHHPVLRRGALTGLHELRDEPWVLPLAGTPSRMAFERAFRAEGVEPPQVAVEANSPSIVRALLLSSDRLALLSTRQVQQELQQGILTVLPVPVSLQDTQRSIGLAYLRDSDPSPAMAAFLAALRQTVAVG